MKEQLQSRLDALKAEFENGQKRLAELENQAATLRQTLLRISGAIQVLEEELSKADGGGGAMAMESADADEMKGEDR